VSFLDKSLKNAIRNGTQAVPYGNILVNMRFRGYLIHFETAPLFMIDFPKTVSVSEKKQVYSLCAG